VSDQSATDDGEPLIKVVRLKPNDELGPFFEPEGFISDDFEELHRWLGISRQTYDDAMAWSERWDFRGPRRDPRFEDERQRLVARLRDEVHEGITIE
jgi:hypothetical protein